MTSKGNPTIKTLLAVINGVGLHLSVTRTEHTQA